MATSQLSSLQTNVRQEVEVLKQLQTGLACSEDSNRAALHGPCVEWGHIADLQRAQQAQSQFITQQQENNLVLQVGPLYTRLKAGFACCSHCTKRVSLPGTRAHTRGLGSLQVGRASADKAGSV